MRFEISKYINLSFNHLKIFCIFVMNCIFCDIIKNEDHDGMIYSDPEVVSFLDIRPLNLGHTLVVPVEHHTDFREMPPESMQHFFAKVQQIALAVEKATGADGFNIICNTGEAASQTIFHLHYHIIPRFRGDNVFRRLEFKQYNSETEMRSFAEKIKKHL
ncbi:MAG: Protein hit [Ignavibacteriaceae bacterium]|nr:Protein hit [Ignavibacteriaceae bacterium]OQY79620.1 MAG: hypothetical protein B6D45_00495 [Ignavibacteriales bacterium UTCHB3]